jgi:hypothetical protein
MSKFAQHLNEHAHPFDTIHNTMEILQYEKKGTHLNTIERYYVCAEYATDNHLNDNQNIFSNAISDALLKTHQQQ